MKWLRFWLSCLAWAFLRWERGGALLRLLNPFAASPILWLLGVLGIVGILREAYWLALFGLAPTVLMAIFIAPYILWKKQQDRADEAEARLKPCILVNGVVVPERKGLKKTACIRVVNKGDEPIRSCTGYLRSIFVEVDGGHLEKNNEILPTILRWSARYSHQNYRDHTIKTEADLDVAVIESTTTGHIQLAVLNDELRGQYWLEERSSYVFEIEIRAENCAPVLHRYRLTISPIGLKAKPDGYGQLIRNKLPDTTFSVLNE